ncbi:MAG: galactitol-1-phosphate 5-dehydrogenase [Lachnospiraceae bacterium]|nr:galactitol-1-phosphate 5-dehydrogenase [Lachnospiraceae bacterium]
MKAWILHKPGSIQYEDADMPLMKRNEVLVKVRAVGICGSDIPRIYRDGAHRMPLIPGHEFSGEVVETETGSDRNWLHKRVGVFPLIPCFSCIACEKGRHEMCRQYSYLGSRRDGGFAEYAAVPQQNLIELPDNVSFEQAAMLEPMAVAVHAMRRVLVKQTDTVVVCGLGTIGIFLVMLLLERGIKNVLAVGNKDFQRDKVLELGLTENQFCDSRQEDIAKWVHLHTDGMGADVFFECVGKNETVRQALNVTAPGGSVCMVGNPYTDMKLDKQTWWKILRNQLEITGTWNSSFFSDGTETGQGDTDWSYVIGLLAKERIAPQQFISHRLGLEHLDEGLHIMRDKREDYLKIMAVLQ